MTDITQLQPAGIWQAFYALTRVPRPSGHLEKVTAFLLDWAKQHNLEHFVDRAGNIIIRKPATPGMEDRKVVTMQAHMDMVPQKTIESTHNFETDPIETWIDGEWLKAKNTTLGADDGIGVATAMAILTDPNIKHGPLEAFITVDEETTMYGVNNLDEGVLTGDILLNFDNEQEGEMIVGSAGGINVTAARTYTTEATDATHTAVVVTLRDLLGGHSGLQINEGRANANKLIARFVRQAIDRCQARLAAWQGGNMRNAIPRESAVTLTLPAANIDALTALVAEWKTIYQAEVGSVEQHLDFVLTPIALPATQLTLDAQEAIVNMIVAVHNGVMRFIPEFPEIVETSSNLAIITVAEGKADLCFLLRSSRDSQLDNLIATISSTAALAGMTIATDHHYPAWQPDFNAPIVKLMEDVYLEMFGKPNEVKVVHAGLECGLIGKVYPHMELVSFGPTLESPHTPQERCHIPSVGRYYDFVVKIIERIPAK